MSVLGKVGRHPIQNHANIVLMAVIDEIFEVVRCAKTAGWRKVPCALVTPGAVKGVFGYGQEFDMCIAHLLHVGHQLVRQLPITQNSILFGVPPPTAEVDFVDVQGPVQGLVTGAIRDPFPISPVVAVQRPDPGGRSRQYFCIETIGIRFVDPVIYQRKLDGVFVLVSFRQVGAGRTICGRRRLGRDEDFPDSFAQ